MSSSVGLLRPGGRPAQRLARRVDAVAHRFRRLAGRAGELDGARPRHRDDEVEAVEQRPRELVAIGREPLRRALAVGGRIPTGAARAEIHRGDELEARREDGPPGHAGHADDAVLERLAQRLERGPLELRELVEHEHAPVREARLTRPRPRPAADERRDGRAVVR